MSKSYETSPADEESNLLNWYSKEDLRNADNIQKNILTMVYEALELVG